MLVRDRHDLFREDSHKHVPSMSISSVKEVPGKRTQAFEKRAPGAHCLFDGDGRGFVEAGLIKVALETERSRYESLRY